MRVLLALLMVISAAGCASLNTAPSSPKNSDSEFEAQQKALKQLYDQGEQFYKTGQLDLAAAEFTKMLEVVPEEENALYRLGTIAFRQRQFELSADYFERTIKSNPKNKKAHFNLANIRLMQSENHFKYYAALADKEADLSKVSKLIADIDDFNSRKSKKKDTGGSLDALAGAIKR